MRHLLPLLLLAGCATTQLAPPPPPPPRLAPLPPGLARILGKDAAAVTALLGAASLDRREGPGRQLQFVRPPCVLDVFLYPDANGREAVRTAASRRPDGSRIDPGDCLARLAPTSPLFAPDPKTARPPGSAAPPRSQ